jgi:2',3'-cyclic-nucleotide 2'-phosphodiesterase (5'-nucleotidase family)
MFADATYDLINPIFKDKTGNSIDVVLLNNGGIRSIISQGPVSEKTAFELMPFENSIVIVKLDGNSIKKMVDYLVKVRLPHPIKGLEIILNKDYSVESVLLNNNLIDENKIYFVATTDYLLDGGDKMYFLAESKETTIIDYKMRDVLIDYFIKTDTLKLKTDNRFIIN